MPKRLAEETLSAAEMRLLEIAQLIPAEVVARVYGVTDGSEAVLQSRGSLPPTIKLGNRRYYPMAELLEQIKATPPIDNTHKRAARKAAISADLLK